MPRSTLWYTVVCVPVSFALSAASILPTDGSAWWDGWVWSPEYVCMHARARFVFSAVAVAG